VEIDGEWYWDGGIVSNTPLLYVLEQAPGLKGLVIQVDLFSARGELPRNLDQVMERHKDIIYSSKTRLNTTVVKDMGEMTGDPRVDIVHMIHRGYHYTAASKDYEFSRATVNELWEAGLTTARKTFAQLGKLKGTSTADGIRTFDVV
jgi:NTE family protein